MNKQEFLNKSWLSDHLKGIEAKAGARYTPELNVNLPISEVFDGLSRTRKFYFEIRKHFGKLNREFSHVASQYDDERAQKIYRDLKKEIGTLSGFLNRIREYNSRPISWTKIGNRANKSQEILWKLLDRLRDLKDEQEAQNMPPKEDEVQSISDRLNSDIHYLHQVLKELRYFKELSSGTQAALSNKPFMLLRGAAGSGKTHLLCDIAKSRTESNEYPSPFILVFGEIFHGKDDPLAQILNNLGINKEFSRTEFLRALNKKGREANCRSLLIIDALNETKQGIFWKRNIDPLIKKLKKYPNIGLVVSVRSGFENEVLTKKQSTFFIHEDHPGFQFREWEAITKFFAAFSLPLPEIPLLVPEFQNPLFLLLFCKGFEGKSGASSQKQQEKVFRGKEGATYIFETFVKNAAKKLTTKFNLPKGRGNSRGEYVIWGPIIKKIAEKMIELNDERVPEKTLLEIIEEAYPQIDALEFAKDLERNLLLTKVTHYQKESTESNGYDYRFPFQKFSDHLIARYLFKKYKEEFGSRTGLAEPKKYFSRRRPLGKFLSQGWNRGLVEALSIQCPEWLNGVEFFEVAPYLKNTQFTEDAFIESLIWRKPDAFSSDRKNILSYINSHIIRSKSGHDNLLNAFLTVSPIPEHPFNADFLHQHLVKFKMPDRDAWWSTFLHGQHGEQKAVDRLIAWGWSEQDKSHVNNESIRLCGVAITWFLTTPNRFLRDKSTKALVSLFTNRLDVLLSLLKKFKDIDDPYISERLYAVAYGCALRSSNDTQLKRLATFVYKEVFSKGNPPTHILIRDYARGVIETALHRKIGLRISMKKITPPFQSNWPQRVPTEKTLKEKYYPDDRNESDRGYYDIRSSVMSPLGDFSNYVLNSAVRHWSGKRMGGREPDRKDLFKKFMNRLTKGQQEMLNKATNSLYDAETSRIVIELVDPSDKNYEKRKIEERKERRKRIKQFEASLSLRRREYFKKEIKPFLDDRGDVRDPLENFDTKLAQRWIFNKVIKLGWKPELHEEFDKNINYHRADRSEHKPERIGKKYQWIALHELIARISDNFTFRGEAWSNSVEDYLGPWQIGTRDIDPSCLLHDPPNSRPKDIPQFSKFNMIRSRNVLGEGISNVDWLRKRSGLPTPKDMIELVDDVGESWLVLEGYKEWQEETPPENEVYDTPTRTLWYMVKSYLVKDRDKRKMVSWAQKQSFMGRWMPESGEFYEAFLGEYPWAPAFMYHYTPYHGHTDWTDSSRGKKLPSKILVTSDEYMSSGSSLDCSTEETIHVRLPAKRVVDEMRISQPFVDGRFYNQRGKLVAFNSGVFYKSEVLPNFILVRKDELVKFLKKAGYGIFWTLLGEKNLIGSVEMGQPLGWLEINGVYRLSRGSKLAGSLRKSFKKSRS